MDETCCDSKHCYGKYGMNMTEETIILQRVKTSSTFLLSPWGTNCWKPRENILETTLTAFSIERGERQTRPCRAFCYYYSLHPNSRHTYNSVTFITLSKTVSHRITAPKICIHNNVERPSISYISVVLKWIQWGHQLAKAASWDACDSRPRHKLQLQWNEACKLGWRIPYKWNRIQCCVYWETHSCIFGTLQLAASLSHFRTCVSNLVKKKKPTADSVFITKCLYNKVSMYILCKANEVFVVGVDVRNLDVNQQQHLSGETVEQKMGGYGRGKRLSKRMGEKKRTFEFSALLNIPFIIAQAKSNNIF